MPYPKPVALCDAIKNVVEELQSLDLAIQEAFHFVLEEDDPIAANDPEHGSGATPPEPEKPAPKPITVPDWKPVALEGMPPLTPHENFFERLDYVRRNEYGGSLNGMATARGISQKTLWTWLHPEVIRSPTCAMMYEVCDKLGWDYHDALSPIGSLEDKH